MIALRASSLSLALTLVACGAGPQSATSGGGGDTASSSTATTGTTGAGTGGTGGAAPCPAPATGTLSFSGVRSTTFDSTMEQVSASFGDPNSSTLTASRDVDMLAIKGHDAAWDVEIDVHLDPSASLPLTITPTSFPSYVGGASFTNGAGLANAFSNDNTFVVKVQEAGCRLEGTFSGGATTEDGLEILTIAQGAFDVPVTAAP